MILIYPSYPNKYKNTYIVVYPNEFEEEFINILEKSGAKSKISRKYNQRLRFLDEYKQQCIQHIEWFELLHKTKYKYPLYSMKIKDTLNIRILFIICQNNAILLTAFTETNNNSYIEAVKIAKERINYLLDNEYIKENDIL